MSELGEKSQGGPVARRGPDPKISPMPRQGRRPGVFEGRSLCSSLRLRSVAEVGAQCEVKVRRKKADRRAARNEN